METVGFRKQIMFNGEMMDGLHAFLIIGNEQHLNLLP